MSGSLRDLKRRIGSVKNTQKITKAMKLVAAAKFARAQTAVKAAKPYNAALAHIGEQVLAALNDLEMKLAETTKTPKKIGVAVVATDRGLCGGLNTNLFKKLQSFTKEKEGLEIDILAYGKKAISYCSKRFKVIEEVADRSDKPSFEDANKWFHYSKNCF